jgi:sugar lactone lactonase YvrE
MLGWGRETMDALGVRMGPETLRDHLLIVFDRNTGRIVENWSQWNTEIGSPQRVLISPYDPNKDIWVSGQGVMLRFSNDGKRLIQKITADQVPQTPNNGAFFPEGMAWLPNGDFWVISSSRIIKFNKDGKYVTEFGSLGSEPGQYRGAHDIVADVVRNRMYIADRQNSRIVVTDVNGKVLDIWPNVVSPYSLGLTADGRHLWVGDGWIQKMQKYDAMSGRHVYQFGTFGVVPGAMYGLHYFTTDVDGNFYLGEDYAGRIQKWRPKKDADPSQLLGQLMWGSSKTSLN